MKTPLMMSEAFGPACCPSAFSPENKFSRKTRRPLRFGSQTQPSWWQKPRSSRSKTLDYCCYGEGKTTCFSVERSVTVFSASIDVFCCVGDANVHNGHHIQEQKTRKPLFGQPQKSSTANCRCSEPIHFNECGE